MIRYRWLVSLLAVGLSLGLMSALPVGVDDNSRVDNTHQTAVCSQIADTDDLLLHLLVQGNDAEAEALLEDLAFDEEENAEQQLPETEEEKASPKTKPAEDTPAEPTKRSLPMRVDNSTNKYFPPILRQVGGSCAQVTAIQNVFCYEINVQRDLDSRREQNQYPAHFTWNCLNSAAGKGSSGAGGWSIAREIGVPTLDVYGSRYGLYRDAGWMSGYEKYFRAMHNRVDSFGVFRIRTPQDLERVKRWLHNHDDPKQEVGGILYFGQQAKGRKSVRIPKGSYEAGKTLFTAWGDGGGHAMTYVGYDDNVGYDINGDGKITNDIDINGDGKVTLADWERGVFIFADSKGTRFGDQGKAYVMYRVCALPRKEGGGGSSAMWVKPKHDYQPTLTLKLKFSFEDRSALRLSAGAAAAPEASRPSRTFRPGLFNGRYRTGDVPMRGKSNNEAIEIGLDISQFAGMMENGKSKFFVTFGRRNNSQATGKVEFASLRHYEQGNLIHEQEFALTGDGSFGDSPLEIAVIYEQKELASEK